MVSSCFLLGQRPMEIQFTTEDGLPSNSVYRAVQDKDGYMWFSTEKGLAKFDGYEFEVFNTSKGLPHNDIFDMVLDGDKIWLATFDSISYMKNDTVFGVVKPERFNNVSVYNHYFQPSGFHIIDLKQTDAIITIQNDSLKVIKELDEYESIVTVIDEENYTLRLVSLSEKKCYYTKVRNNIEIDTFIFEYEPRYPSTSIQLENKKVMFKKDNIITWDSDKFETYSFKKILGMIPNIISFTVFDNKIFFYAEEKNFVLDDNLNLTYGYDFLIDRIFTSITKDNNGNIWATSKSGISFFKNPDITSQLYKNEFFDDKFVSINADKNGNIFVTTQQGRILLHQTDENLELKYKLDVNHATKLVLDPDASHCFVLDRQTGVQKYMLSKSKAKKVNYANYKAPRPDKELAIKENGDIAIAQAWGVYLIKNGIAKKVFNKRSYAVEFQEDTLWIGTTKGLFTYVDGNSEAFPLNGENFYVKSIYKDKRNNIWIIPEKEGLWKINNGVVEKIQNLNDLYINNMEVDAQNNIWLSTTTGLYQCIYEENIGAYARQKHGFSKGIKSKNIIDAKVIGNSVYAISDQFLHVFDKSIRSPEKASNFLIESIQVNDELRQLDDLSTLKHNENSFKINYNCITSGEFGKINYKWNLDPSSEKWETTQSTSIQFNSISPGDYTLKIKPYDFAGNQLSKEKSIKISVKRPWYQTKAFYFLCLCALGIGFFFYDKWRKKENQLKLMEENKIAEQLHDLRLKAIRAQMNPHFIFNALNSIQKFIYLKSPEQANQYIVKFSKLMRLILDSTNKKFTSLNDEIKMLNLYISLEQLRFDNIFKHEVKLDDEIDPELTYIPSNILQPFIENAINHGLAPKQEGGILNIRFKIQGDGMLCEIEDNGIGRKDAKKLKKNNHISRALKIIEERIELIRNQEKYNIDLTFTDLEDAKGSSLGTRVTLKLPKNYIDE